MKSTGRTLTIAILVLAALAESAVIVKLTRENSALRDKGIATRKFEDELGAKLARLKSEVDVLRVQNNDTLKLHHEVQKLRSSTNELSALRAENEQLKATPPATNDTEEATAKLASLPLDYHTREDLTFAGYDTPQAALESSFWALREGDPEALLASLTGDQRTRFQNDLRTSGKSLDDFAADLRKDAEKFVSYSVLDQDAVENNVIVLTVHKSDGENHVAHFYFTRVGEEWRISDIKENE